MKKEIVIAILLSAPLAARASQVHEVVRTSDGRIGIRKFNAISAYEAPVGATDPVTYLTGPGAIASDLSGIAYGVGPKLVANYFADETHLCDAFSNDGDAFGVDCWDPPSGGIREDGRPVFHYFGKPATTSPHPEQIVMFAGLDNDPTQPVNYYARFFDGSATARANNNGRPFTIPWRPFLPLSIAIDSAYAPSSSPCAVSWTIDGAERTDIFYTAHGHLLHAWTAPDNFTFAGIDDWGAPGSMNPDVVNTVMGDPTCVSWGEGRLDVFTFQNQQNSHPIHTFVQPHHWWWDHATTGDANVGGGGMSRPPRLAGPSAIVLGAFHLWLATPDILSNQFPDGPVQNYLALLNYPSVPGDPNNPGDLGPFARLGPADPPIASVSLILSEPPPRPRPVPTMTPVATAGLAGTLGVAAALGIGRRARRRRIVASTKPASG
jgi:hypothetical protein